MSVPILSLGECLINTIIEILVVREDDMASDIIELRNTVSKTTLLAFRHVTYESFRSHIRGCETTWSLIGVDDQPGWAILRYKVRDRCHLQKGRQWQTI